MPGSPETRAERAESNAMSASTTTTMASSIMSASPPASAPGSEREDDDHQVQQQHQQQHREGEEMMQNQSHQHQSAQALSPAAPSSNNNNYSNSNSGGESRAQYNSSAANYSLPQHLLGMGISVGVPADDVLDQDVGMNSNTKAIPLKSVSNTRPKVFSRAQSQPNIDADQNGGKAQTKSSFSKSTTTSNNNPNRARSPRKISPLKKPAISPTAMNRQTSQASSNSSSSHQATRMTEPLQLQPNTSMTDRLNRLRSAASNRNTKNNGGKKGPIRRSQSDVSRLQSNQNENTDQQAQDQEGNSKQRSFSSSPIAKYQQPVRQTGRDELGRISERPNIDVRRSLTNPIPQNRRELRRQSTANLADVQEEGEDDDVLMLIAKARAKLEMEGEDNEAAAAVLAQLEQQQQQQQEGRENLDQQKALGIGSVGNRSVASSLNGGSQGGIASLPGAYEKVPGGKFEKKETFTHESITRYSESAQMRTPLSNHSPQQRAVEGFANSDLDSISSGESVDLRSDIMEIEFSQESFSNHNGDDDVKHDDKKPAALGGVTGGGSVSVSLTTQSINLDDLYSDRNESGMPAARAPASGDADRGPGDYIDNYARIPSASSAPSDISDDESEDSSHRRRRRQRHRHRRSDDRKNHGGDRNVDSKKNASKPMKDTSAESEASQLVIAAEVVRSEEEMVTELRQKVEKEILESMAEELIKMEASQSAISSAEMDMSYTTIDQVGKASPKTRRGSTWGRRRASLNRGQLQQVPPSPMASSTQVGRARQQRITPSQNRGLNLRGLNLSGFTSPAFLRGTSRGRSKQKMPQLRQANFDGNSSSDSDNDNEIRRNHSADPRNVVDAVEVIPASPLQRRAVSQPLPRFQSVAVRTRQQTMNGTNAQTNSRRAGEGGYVYNNGSNGSAQTSALISQLSRLRSLSTTTSAVPASATDTLERQESNASLPDLATPPPVRNNNSASGESSAPSGRQASMSRFGRRPSTCASVQEDPQPAAPLQQQQIQGMPLDDSDGMDESLQFRRSSLGSGHHRDALNTQNSSSNTMENSDRIPSDWDLHQMEMAEMGHGSETTLALARRQRAARRNSGVPVADHGHAGAVDGTNNGWEEPMITYDDRLPASWVAPVGVLFGGAVVLGIVLFTI